VSASVVLSGLIPEKHNVLAVRLKGVAKNAGKSASNYQLRVNGPLNECLLDKGEGRVYVENNCFVIIDYFEEEEAIEGIEPYCSLKVPVNSLNWSEDSLMAAYSAKYHDPLKNSETNFDFEFKL
jgi:hypothetical protein